MAQEDIKKGYIELFFVSLLALYLELFVIRLLSCDVRIFTVFRTFPLITCFIGLGLGMVQQKGSAYKWAPICLVGFLCAVAFVNNIGMSLCGFPSANNFAWQNLTMGSGAMPQVLLLCCLAELFILLFGPFFLCYCIGSRIGSLFTRLPTLKAYSVDLAGAVAGSVLFTFLAFLRTPPMFMLAVPLVILFFSVIIPYRHNIAVATVLLFALVASPFVLDLPERLSFRPLLEQVDAEAKCQHNTYWSPYQRIDLMTFKVKDPPEFLGLEVGVNRAHYQLFLDDDINRAQLSPMLCQLLDERALQFNFPFVLMPGQCLDDVLVVGPVPDKM